MDQDAKEESTQKIADVGRVMTEEEYEEWKKDRDGRGQDGQDTGIDWEWVRFNTDYRRVPNHETPKRNTKSPCMTPLYIEH